MEGERGEEWRSASRDVGIDVDDASDPAASTSAAAACGAAAPPRAVSPATAAARTARFRSEELAEEEEGEEVEGALSSEVIDEEGSCFLFATAAAATVGARAARGDDDRRATAADARDRRAENVEARIVVGWR